MATNPVRTLIAIDDEPGFARPGARKPPQSEFAVALRQEDYAHLAPPRAQTARILSFPKTWTEAIQDPQVWAVIRPLLVDED